MPSKIPSSAVRGALAALLVTGAASAAEPEAATRCTAKLPPALAPPPGHALAFALRAEGVQIYACTAAAGGAPAWTLQAPEATLLEADGRRAGTHGAGPTWSALDGSTVAGAKLESAAGDPGAVPWLLLRATSHGEQRGRMTAVTFVQRVRTAGGVAPAGGCTGATVGTTARVPYTAEYCFYGAGTAAAAATTTTGARP